MIVTRKIEIACRNKEDYPKIQEWLKQCRLMANKVMTHYYTAWQDMLDHKAPEQKQNDYWQQKYGCSFKNSGYRYLREKFRDLPSYFARDIGTKVYQDFQADLKNGLLKGERSLRTYRNGWLPLHNEDIHLRKEEKEYVLRWIQTIDLSIVWQRPQRQPLDCSADPGRSLQGQRQSDCQGLAKEEMVFAAVCGHSGARQRKG